MLKDGRINLETNLTSPTEIGLTVDVKLDHKGDDKPMLFTFIYKLSTAQLRQWLVANKYLCEGALAFVIKGIEVVIPYGPDKIDKSAFSIDDKDGERIWLPLIDQPVTFSLHRNLFGGKEWECFYNDEAKEEKAKVATPEDDIPF